MKLKLNKTSKLIIIFVMLALIVTGITYYTLTRPLVTFKDNHPSIQINSRYNPVNNIKSVKDGKKTDVVINDKNLDITKFGDYTIIYKYKDNDYKVTVTVTDKNNPVVQTKDIEIDLGMNPKAKDLIESVQDDSKTTIKFAKKYKFDKEGKKSVKIIVKDKYSNSTTKKATITILSKDEEKPTIEGLTDKTVIIKTTPDLNDGVTVKDNRDPNPTLTIDSSSLDTNKVGTYEITYTAKDRSGNTFSATRKITVIEKSNQSIGSSEQSGEKIVYLTFDDGPSANTQKVLDILDKYNAKATFFVTGNGSNYNYLIKEAYKRGNTIGLHTYCHEYNVIYKSTDAYFQDLDKVGQLVKEQIGFVPKYIRFPGGSSNTVSRHYSNGIMSILTKEVISRGYQYYDWNCGTGDASGNNIPTNTIISTATNASGNNLIMLAHDTQAKNTTVEALPTIIQYYQSRGYSFKAIDDNSYVPHHSVNN